MLLIDGLANRERVRTHRQNIATFAAHLVSDGNPNGVESIEHVQLCNAQSGDAIYLHTTLQRSRVEPAAPTRTAGYRTVFVSANAKSLPDFVIQLGWKRSS